MMLRKVRYGRAAILAVAVFLAGATEAAAVSFDFTTPSGTGNNCAGSFCESYDFSSDGIDVNVTAETTGPLELVNQNQDGLGVTSWVIDQTAVDGIVFGETINFAFSPEITLDILTLSLVDWNDDLILLIDGQKVPGGAIDIPGTGVTEIDLAELLPNVEDRTGIVIGLTTNDWTDNFKVAAMDVNPTAAHAPEPGSLLLFASGLLGLFPLIRRYC